MSLKFGLNRNSNGVPELCETRNNELENLAYCRVMQEGVEEMIFGSTPQSLPNYISKPTEYRVGYFHKILKTI